MNFRAAVIFIVLGFIGLLLVMGTLSLVRWLKKTYPRSSGRILLIGCFALLGLGAWGYMEASDRPAFHAGDLVTLQQPIVVRVVSANRNTPTTSCIVDIYKHVAVVEPGSGVLTARVESNNTSTSSFCPIGAEVQVELAWLQRYTLTHRHS